METFAQFNITDATGSTSYTKPRVVNTMPDSTLLSGAALLQQMVGGSIVTVERHTRFHISSAAGNGDILRSVALQYINSEEPIDRILTIFVPTVDDTIFLPDSPIVDTASTFLTGFNQWVLLNARLSDGIPVQSFNGGVLSLESK